MKTLVYFSLILTLVMGCKKETDPIPKPVAAFSYSLDSKGVATFTNLSQNASSYQWTTNNILYPINSTGKNMEVHFYWNGSYKVTLKAIGEEGVDITYHYVEVTNL